MLVTPPTDGAPEAGLSAQDCAAARGTTPERLRRRLRGDLDDIVLKALRPEPERRYGTAGQLADDIVRHLEGRPVRARPDTVTYRTGKFIRRHRLGLAAVGGAFLLLGGFAYGIQRQAERTAIERDRAEEVLGFMVGLFGSADPYVARGDTLTVRAVLGRGAVRAREELAGQPAAQATLMEAIGEVYKNLGMVDSAASLLEGAVAARRRISDGDERMLRSSLVEWGGLLAKAGRLDQAPPVLEEALALHRRIGRPGTVEFARILNDVGNAWQGQGDRDRAEPLLLEALAVYRTLPAPTSGTVSTLNNLGWLRISAGDPDSAVSLFRRGLELRRAMGASDHDVAASLSSLAEALERTGAVAAADSAISEALRLERAYLPEGHPLIAGLLSRRAGLHRGDQPELAKRLYREVIDIWSETYGEDHTAVAGAKNGLALVLMEEGRGPEAVELFRQAEATYRRAVGNDHVNTVIAELNLARLLFQLGETAEAVQRFAHAVPIVRRAFPDDPRYLEDEVSLGFLQCANDAPDQGLGHLEPAVAGLRPPEGAPATNAYLRALNAMGSCLADDGRVVRARSVLQRSLDASSDRPGDDPYRRYARSVLARLPPDGGG
jgi:serine/threonine-protein kinase